MKLKKMTNSHMSKKKLDKKIKVSLEQDLKHTIFSSGLWQHNEKSHREWLEDRIEGIITSGKIKPKKLCLIVEWAISMGFEHVVFLIIIAMDPIRKYKTYIPDLLNMVIDTPNEITKFMKMYKPYYYRKFATGKGDHQISSIVSVGITRVYNKMLLAGIFSGKVFLSHLRGMSDVGVDIKVMEECIKKINDEEGFLGIPIIEFVMADKYVPELRSSLEPIMQNNLIPYRFDRELADKTILLINNSDIMTLDADCMHHFYVNAKYIDLAIAAAIEIEYLSNNDIKIFTFSEELIDVSGNRGFALGDAIRNSQCSSEGRTVFAAINKCSKMEHDRIIVITDSKEAPRPVADKAYLMYIYGDLGIRYGEKWVCISGDPSDNVEWIQKYEEQLEYLMLGNIKD